MVFILVQLVGLIFIDISAEIVASRDGACRFGDMNTRKRALLVAHCVQPYARDDWASHWDLHYKDCSRQGWRGLITEV